MTDFFPPIKPYDTGMMSVDAPHEIYWEQSGNPDGVPIVVFHGGPGGGCAPIMRQFFNPAHYRIILFDQRGCGNSTPLCCLEKNTTAHLIADIEKLRVLLDIEKWHVFGGSWGSTLALSYATEHAEKCLSLILRGIFLMEQADIDWFMNHNKYVTPQAWENFASIIPEEKRGDLLNAYYDIFTSNNEDKKLEAAMAWDTYETTCSKLIAPKATFATQEEQNKALSISMIECHYFVNHLIKEEDSLLKKIENFRHVPATIIHGKYDMVCPIISAHKLHQAWPEADYIVAETSGHSAFEDEISSLLIDTTQNYKTIK